MSTQDIWHKTTMVVSINNVVNNNMQADTLQHGSIPHRMWYVCAGVTISSNYEEPERYFN